MEEDKELPSDSDSDDEDYVPEGAAEKVSEESEGEKTDSDGETDDTGTGKRRKRNESKENKKKIKAAEVQVNENSSEEKVENPEEEKKRKDRLWADFMKDCGAPTKSTKSTSDSSVEEKKSEEKPNEPEVKESTKVKVTQVVEFAGEKVTIEKEVDKSCLEARASPGNARGRGRGRSSGGLSAVLGMFGKKGNLSTLEKSKLDWDKFKKDEGIQEQLQSHNKGRNGYLEKQDFLQRADVRQFELEKEMRSSKRSNR